MKALRISLAAFLIPFTAGLLAPGIARAQDDGTVVTTDTVATDDNTGGDSPSFDYFYNALQDYGQWIQVEGYGYCWQPDLAANDQNWQPYTDGYWAYTDAGWTWVSYEDFGWITYHYGRWAQVEDVGWIWVPDYQWAPAWVSWRGTPPAVAEGPNTADAYVGWAPLPPEAHFVVSIGISFWADSNYDIGPRSYNFCRVRDFGAPVLGPVIIDRSRNITIINHTTNITNITTNNNVVFNGGPGYRYMEKHVAHPVPTLQLVRQTDPAYFRQNGPKGMHTAAKGNQLFIPAPIIAPPKNNNQFKPQKVSKTIDKPVFNKGWKGVDPKQKVQTEDAIKAQTKGIKPNQPAIPVTAQQLAIIPKGSATPAPGPNGSPGKSPFPGRSPGKGFGKTTPTPGPNGTPVPTPGGKHKPFVTPSAGGTPGATPGGTPEGTPAATPGGKRKPFITPAPNGGNPEATPGSTPVGTPTFTPGGKRKPFITPAPNGGNPESTPVATPGGKHKPFVTPPPSGSGPESTPASTPAFTPGGKRKSFNTPIPGSQPVATPQKQFSTPPPRQFSTPPPKIVNTPPPRQFSTPPPKLATPPPPHATPPPNFQAPKQPNGTGQQPTFPGHGKPTPTPTP